MGTRGHALENGKDEKSVNYSVRILGRRGTQGCGYRSRSRYRIQRLRVLRMC